MSFPGWGRAFQTSIIAIVLINQIIGPILFKVALRKVGEAGKAAGEGIIDLDAAIPTALICGSGSDAVATAVKMLAARWRVVVVAADAARATSAKAAIMRHLAVVKAIKGAGPGAAVARIIEAVRRAGAGGGADGAAAPQLPAETAGTTAAPAAPAPAPAPAHGGGGHEEADHFVAEEMVEVVALLEGSSRSGGDAENPFCSDDAVASGTWASPSSTPAGATPAGTPLPSSRGGGTDIRYSALIAAVQRSRTLQAVACMLPSDLTNFAAASVVLCFIAAAPKSSHLHSIRIVTMLHGNDAEWAETFASMGVITLHPQLHSVDLAARLLRATAGKPLALVANASTDELRRSMQSSLEGAHLWDLYFTAAEVEGGGAQGGAGAGAAAASGETLVRTRR